MTIRSISYSSRSASPLQKAITALVTVGVGVLALMFSAVLLAVLVVVAVVGGGYVWWRTRAIRQQMREQMRDFPPPGAEHTNAAFRDEPFSGEIIEGEVIRVEPAADRLGHQAHAREAQHVDH